MPGSKRKAGQDEDSSRTLAALGVVLNEVAIKAIDRLAEAEELEERMFRVKELANDVVLATPDEMTLLAASLKEIQDHRSYYHGVEICPQTVCTELDYSTMDLLRVGRLIGARGYEVDIWHCAELIGVCWTTSQAISMVKSRKSLNITPVSKLGDWPLEPQMERYE